MQGIFNLNDLMNAIDGEDFEERPVDIKTFVQSEKYLNLPPLSDIQYTVINASSQIYKHSTLVSLFGYDEGTRRYKETCNEVILQLGKGSGKDYISTIACSYIVYLLLCLKDPARYYGKPPGDAIDIINIAINSQQANNVFFKGFKNRIENSEWFQGKYNVTQGRIEFEKAVTVHSGHSERESWEGYNVIYVVLDEISGFALESTTGHDQAKTAQAVYDMYRASVDSRFPDFGKLVLLSFPRFKGDFIQQRYDAVIAEKETIIKTHQFKIDPDLPDGTEGNEFEIEWEEDHIISYFVPRVFALRRPTWDVNPTRRIEDFTVAFLTNTIDALSRFACMPPDAIDAVFKDKAKIEAVFSGPNGVDEYDRFTESFVPNPDHRYYMHVDLARKKDRCALAMAHVDRWTRKSFSGIITEPAPYVVVDLLKWWTPSNEKNVDFTEVREFIVNLKRKGFNLAMVTFDQWESNDMMNYLNSKQIDTELLSVNNREYDDLSLVVHDERILGPDVDLVRKELLRLKIMPNGKIDHPRRGSKDLADATAGAVYNAIRKTPRHDDTEIEIETLSSIPKPELNVQEEERPKTYGAIRAPKAIPADIAEYLENMTAL
jgi:hypothetical protein